MNRFAFIIPMRNAHATIRQTLRSLIAQTHSSWRAIVIDDASTQDSFDASKRAILDANTFIGDDRITLLRNDVRMWEVANVITGIKMCSGDEIACRLDADDWLTDTDALSIINACYDSSRCDALWTMHRWNFTPTNISGPMPDDADPYVHPWVSSHLKTFRRKVIDGVPYENFVNMNGTLIQRAGDQGLYLPVLHNAKRRVFLPLVTYHYTINDRNGAIFHTDDAKFQKAEADFIRKRGYVKHGPSWEEVIQKEKFSTSN